MKNSALTTEQKAANKLIAAEKKAAKLAAKLQAEAIEAQRVEAAKIAADKAEAARLEAIKAQEKEATKQANKVKRMIADVLERENIAAAQIDSVNGPLMLNNDKVEAKEKVTIRMVVTQVSKNPFSFEHSATAKLSDVSLRGMSNKIGFAIGGQLTTLAQNAINYKAKAGKYPTAFNPKAVFKVEVFVNGKICLYSLATKGIDAIRLTNKDGVIDRAAIAEKFNFIALQIEAFAAMAEAINFEAKAEAILSEGAAETATV